LGPVLWWTSLREEKRLAQGHSYEPATIIDRRNWEGVGKAAPMAGMAECPAESGTY